MAAGNAADVNATSVNSVGSKSGTLFTADTNTAINPNLQSEENTIQGEIGGVKGQQAAQAGAAQQAAVTNANAATAQGVTANQQGENSQMALIAQLQNQAAGKGPSMANINAQNALNQGLNQQLAMAGSQRGGNAGEALKNAQMRTSPSNRRRSKYSGTNYNPRTATRNKQFRNCFGTSCRRRHKSSANGSAKPAI